MSGGGVPGPDRVGAVSVTLRYWAAAKAATGVDSEQVDPGTLRELLADARARHPDLHRVLAVASIVVDGVPGDDDDAVPEGADVEVLPPFAGG